MKNFETLPPRDTKRWTPYRKAQIVQSVRSGILQEDEVLALYGISSE